MNVAVERKVKALLRVRVEGIRSYQSSKPSVVSGSANFQCANPTLLGRVSSVLLSSTRLSPPRSRSPASSMR